MKNRDSLPARSRNLEVNFAGLTALPG